MSKLFIISFTLFFFYEVSAYAYIDPGLGSIILQALAGAVAAAATFLLYWRNKVKDFFKKFKKSNNETNNENNNKDKK